LVQNTITVGADKKMGPWEMDDGSSMDLIDG
jgi:hypothetical protein